MGSPYDCQAPNVLPALLQQRDEIVDSQHDVTDQMILSHANVSNSNTETQHLLELELDGALDIGDLLREVLGMGNRSGELSSLGETGAEQTWDLLDELLGRNEGVVFARKLLDKLLVLVEFLQIVDRHGLERVMLGAIDVVLVTENAVPRKKEGKKGCQCLHVFRGSRVVMNYQMDMPGLGTWGSFTVPEKRLSRWGS